MIRNRALSNLIAVIILIVVVLLIFVPVLFYLYAVNQQNVVSSSIYNNYVYLKNLQLNQVVTGHPSIYYSGTTICFEYSNGTFVPPSNLTIVGILYLNPNTGVWSNITTLTYPIVISKGQTLTLPSNVEGDPIIIVTSLGNIFFLSPGSSIGPFSPVR